MGRRKTVIEQSLPLPLLGQYSLHLELELLGKYKFFDAHGWVGCHDEVSEIASGLGD
jgi:hypothetical protein